MSIYTKLTNVDQSKECLKFLANRIMSEKYRGNQISQHNRYDMNVVKIMLKKLFDICGNDLMQIRDADLKKRPNNIDGEQKYAQYVNEICKSEVGRGTQDSIRKNLFVDFHRMGFINRYNGNKEANNPYEKAITKYVSLTEVGRKFALSNNIFDQYMLYTRGVDNLLMGIIDDILGIILELGKLNETEYTFFVSYINLELDGTYYGKEKIIEMVKEYRSLSKFTKDSVVDVVKEYCNPDNFSGDKTQKKDYGNWTNETQQVFMLLSQTIFFEQRVKTIYPRIDSNFIFDDQEKLNRSLAEKQKYHSIHNVLKREGFELHHVVPLCWAKTKHEFTILDTYQNMVYIDGYSHSKITQNRNRNVLLEFENKDAKFIDNKAHTVYCKYDENILYDFLNQKAMYEYNRNILNSIK